MKVCEECKTNVEVLVYIDDASNSEICEKCLGRHLKRKDIVRCDDCEQYIEFEISKEYEDEYGDKIYYCEGCDESQMPGFVDSQEEYEQYLETRNFDD